MGLITPQNISNKVTPFMRPAPHPNDDELYLREDKLVTDPLSDELHNLWNKTARHNRGVFTELFRTVPSDSVRSERNIKVWIYILSKAFRADRSF